MLLMTGGSSTANSSFFSDCLNCRPSPLVWLYAFIFSSTWTHRCNLGIITDNEWSRSLSMTKIWLVILVRNAVWTSSSCSARSLRSNATVKVSPVLKSMPCVKYPWVVTGFIAQVGCRSSNSMITECQVVNLFEFNLANCMIWVLWKALCSLIFIFDWFFYCFYWLF